MEPPEVDKPEDVANGTVVGAKNAAVRKLNHELGIPPEELPVSQFKFLTRLHYWAADTITHGQDRYAQRLFLVSSTDISTTGAHTLMAFFNRLQSVGRA
jgi:isopentenyldiphosphate isomerase